MLGGEGPKMITISSYEKTASLVLSLLILIGAAALVLLGIWLTSSLLRSAPSVAVQLYDEGTGVRDSGSEYDPDVVNPGEQVETNEMTLWEAFQIVDTLGASASMFSEAAVIDENILLPGGTQGDGRTQGDGDGRGRGRKRHWEFIFPTGITAAEYARQLDYFGIELAVLQPGGKVAYVSKLASRTPTVRYGASETEQRYYLTWLKGELQTVERDILTRARVEHDERLILKFLPPPLEAQLVEMEAAKAGAQRDLVRATHFGIRPKNRTKTDEYEFFVMNQVLQ